MIGFGFDVETEYTFSTSQKRPIVINLQIQMNWYS